jgi:CBS domain-containing protein
VGENDQLMAPTVENKQAVVADAMLIYPKLCAPTMTVGELREFFLDDHVHAALIVDAGKLVAVVERRDLSSDPSDEALASTIGTIDGRVIARSRPLEAVRIRMVEESRRRLAVVDEAGRLVGLLCLKRTGLGFCSPASVVDRQASRRSPL